MPSRPLKADLIFNVYLGGEKFLGDREITEIPRTLHNKLQDALKEGLKKYFGRYLKALSFEAYGEHPEAASAAELWKRLNLEVELNWHPQEMNLSMRFEAHDVALVCFEKDLELVLQESLREFKKWMLTKIK